MAITYLITKYLPSLELRKAGKLRITNNFSLFPCLMASLLVLLGITLVQTKLSWYIFPLYPFAALLIGKFFEDLVGTKNKVVQAASILIFTTALGIQIITNLYLTLNL